MSQMVTRVATHSLPQPKRFCLQWLNESWFRLWQLMAGKARYPITRRTRMVPRIFQFSPTFDSRFLLRSQHKNREMKQNCLLSEWQNKPIRQRTTLCLLCPLMSMWKKWEDAPGRMAISHAKSSIASEHTRGTCRATSRNRRRRWPE